MASVAGVCTALRGFLPQYFNLDNVDPHIDDVKIASSLKTSMMLLIDKSRGAKQNGKGRKSEGSAKKDSVNKDAANEVIDIDAPDNQAEKKITDEEKALKEEEKKRKEEEKLKKEEEKERKLEARRLREEEQQRKMKEKQEEMLAKKRKEELAAKKFGSFFQKQCPSVPTTPIAVESSTEDKPVFLPFQLKPNQTLTPIVQSFVKDRFLTPCFDSDINSQDEPMNNLYLAQLKGRIIVPHKTGRKIRINRDSDLDIIEDGKELRIGKLLQFHDNVRPAWFGTWTKKSKNVSGRKPFAQDSKFLNYEVDSDEEWDEGGPGESLDGSDAEPDDPEDDYDIDNEFMVPHGYLSGSEEEGELAEGTGAGDDADKFREKEMLARKRLRVKLLKPVVIGPLWNRDRKACNETSFSPAHQVMKKFRVVFNCRSSSTTPSPNLKTC